MTTETLVVFTRDAISTILNSGGTQHWVLARDRARCCDYAVLCRKTEVRTKNQAPETHGAAFLVGRISGVVPSSSQKGRWLVVFDKYAELDLPGIWRWQNPVKYTTLEELEIDVDSLDFKPMPKPR